MRDRVRVPEGRRTQRTAKFATCLVCVAALLVACASISAWPAYAASEVAAAGSPVTLLFGVPSHWNDTPITFTLTADGDAAPITTYYQLGDGDVTTYTVPVDYDVEGMTQLTYWSKDDMGQVEPANHATIRLDFTRPTASHTAQAHYTDGTAEISLRGADALSYGGLRWMLDDDPTWNTAADEATAVVVSEPGAHTLTYWSFDLAGNESTRTAVAFTVQSSPAIALRSGSTTLDNYDDRYAIVGALTVGGDGVGGQTVTLQTSTNDVTFTDSAITATTDTDGSFVLSCRPRSKTYYRVRFEGTTSFVGTDSASISVLPVAKVSEPVAPKTMSHRGYYSVAGHLWPRHTSGSTSAVRIQKYRYVHGAWKYYGSVKAKVRNYSSYSKYSVSMRLQYTGRWRLRAYAPADSGHSEAWSSFDYVTVR